MHHQRLMALPILAYVFEFEALRQVEVELHGRKLPEPPDGVHPADIDFRPVECSFAENELIGNTPLAEHLLQRVLCQLPLLLAAHVMAAVVGVQAESSTWNSEIRRCRARPWQNRCSR